MSWPKSKVDSRTHKKAPIHRIGAFFRISFAQTTEPLTGSRHLFSVW